MSDLDERIRLLEKIADLKARFQAIAKPWMALIKASAAAGENVDIPASCPPELPALSKLIRQLEDELLMLDPTADIDGVDVEYRQIMQDRSQRRHRSKQIQVTEDGTDRKGLVKQWLEQKPGRTIKELYINAGVDKSDYYRWLNGKSPDGRAVDIRLKRALAQPT